MNSKSELDKNSKNDKQRGKISLLLVDDDPDLLFTQAEYFAMHGIEVETSNTAKQAIAACQRKKIDVIITDFRMPGMSGLELLKNLKDIGENSEVIVFTGYGTVESAIEAIRSGAYSYLLKPMSMDRLLIEVQKAAQTGWLKQENFILKHSEAKRGPTFFEFSSPEMREVLDQLEVAGATDSTILLLGESGVGKEIAANFVHANSQRSDKAFVKVHCASLSSGLLESELFGHEKGAFTGAVEERKGRFELANGGTIFLDEISTVSIENQVKLLRVIQEKKIERVGGAKTMKVDFRLITASNDDLKAFVESGKFRHDLYYRIGVIPIHVPPLRNMKHDIPSLSRFFISKMCSFVGKSQVAISDEAISILSNYTWPGNIRELQNVIERAVVLDMDGIVGKNDLPMEISGFFPNNGIGIESSLGENKNLRYAMAGFEERYLKKMLLANNFNVTKTAKVLGISRRSLQQKISKYSLK